MCKMYFYVLNVWDRRLTLYWYLLPIQTESARFKICEILQTLCCDGGGLGEFSVFLGLWLCLTLRCCHCGTVLGDEFWPSFFYNHKIVYVNQPLCAIDRRTLTQPHAHPQESILQLQVTRLEWAFFDTTLPSLLHTCQLSRLRRESHACGLKTSISRRLTLAGQFLTPDWKMWVVSVLLDTISKNMLTQTHVRNENHV